MVSSTLLIRISNLSGGTHVDSYYHSIIPTIISMTGDIPDPSKTGLRYASLPLYFVLQAILQNMLNLDSITANSILYVVFAMTFLILLYTAHHSLSEFALNENSQNALLGKLYITLNSTFLSVIIYIFYLSSGPHMYGLILFYFVVYLVIFSNTRDFVKLTEMLIIYAISISLSHHISQVAVLSMLASLLLYALSAKKFLGNRYNSVNSEKFLYFTPLSIIIAIFVYQWFQYHINIIIQVLELEGLMKLNYVFYYPARTPFTEQVMIQTRRIAIVSYLVLQSLLYLGYLLAIKNSKSLIKSLKNDTKFEFYAKALITLTSVGLPTLLLGGFAAERAVVYTSFLITLMGLTSFIHLIQVEFITKRKSVIPKIVVFALLTMTLTVYSTYVVQNTLIQPYIGRLSPQVHETHIAKYFVNRNAHSDSSIFTDFFMAGFIRYYTYMRSPTTYYDSIRILDDYNSNEAYYNIITSSEFFEKLRNAYVLLSSRSFQRMRALYGVEAEDFINLYFKQKDLVLNLGIQTGFVLAC